MSVAPAPTPSRIRESELDLKRVSLQMLVKLPDWSPERVSAAITEYRRFLSLCFWFPQHVLIPGPDVTEVWHLHALNSEKYMEDCQKIFHRYLHVTTYNEWVDGSKAPGAKMRTLLLYQQTFGVEPPEDWKKPPIPRKSAASN